MATNGLGHLDRISSHNIDPEKANLRCEPLDIALMILGVIGLTVAAVGLAGFGAHQGWWSAGGLSHLGQINSIMMMGVGGGTVLIMMILGLVKTYLTPKEILFERPVPNDLKPLAFGFKPLKGFTMKIKSGYIMADNQAYDPASEFRVAKVELHSFFKRKIESDLPELSAEDVTSISENIKLASQEYKIHLMPKPEHMELVVNRLIRKMGEDENLKKHVAQYKVMLGEEKEDGSIVLSTEPDSHGEHFPRIVLYAENKEAGQAILNAIYTLFPDAEELGDNITPRGNHQVNALIYYAHGSGDIKNAAADCHFELFEETTAGEYTLQIPRK